jgi:hypothetical protein
MTHRVLSIIGVSACILWFAVGCAATVATPEPPTPLPPTATSAPVPPAPTSVPATPTPGITIEDLSGIWRAVDPTADGYIQLNLDGTYHRATALPYLDTSPLETGEFRIEGNLLTFITSNQSRSCAGQSGSHLVQLTGSDQIQMTPQDDPCQVRANRSRGHWERVAP